MARRPRLSFLVGVALGLTAVPMWRLLRELYQEHKAQRIDPLDQDRRRRWTKDPS